MSAAESVTPDPKKEKPRTSQSETRYPYNNLDKSVAVARAIYELGGGACTRAQLAPMLKYRNAKSGTFQHRILSARIFGLVERDGRNLRTTQRGVAIVAPVDEPTAARAKRDAFLGVELFRKVYRKYEGGTLPTAAGLRNLVTSEFGVVPNRAAPAVRVLLDSAGQAGFFASGDRNQMIEPLISDRAAGSRTRSEPRRREVPQDGENRSGGREDAPSTTPTDVHPAILGLLRDLPPPGTELSETRREGFLAAITAAVNFIYPQEME